MTARQATGCHRVIIVNERSGSKFKRRLAPRPCVRTCMHTSLQPPRAQTKMPIASSFLILLL